MLGGCNRLGGGCTAVRLGLGRLLGFFCFVPGLFPKRALVCQGPVRSFAVDAFLYVVVAVEPFVFLGSAL